MNVVAILLLFFLSTSFLYGGDTLRTYRAERTKDIIIVDGLPNEPVWQTIIPAKDFIQNQPEQGTPATMQTEVRVVYDDFALYVFAKMFDPDPSKILHELGNRDEDGLNADFFRFVIDPYNKHQDFFDFGVYASGVQVDRKWTDYTFNAVWSSAVQITNEGWTVEMMIPYSAIRFPATSVQEWGLQLTRMIRRTREFDQWALTPNGSGNPLKYFGTLTGIENIKPTLRLSLTPYVSAYVSKAPEYDANGEYEYRNSFSYNAGADVKYGIDERFTIDMTLLPDFGQVQSDSKVKFIGFGERVYDENRPFFQEGVDLFNKDALFYSRRIGKTPDGFNGVYDSLGTGEVLVENPREVRLVNATKFSGRTDNGLGIGVFNAVTKPSLAVISDSVGNTRKIMTEPLTNYNVSVLDQQFSSGSSMYLINTNVLRNGFSRDANVTGSGFTLVNKKNTYSIDGRGAYSKIFRSTGYQKKDEGYNYVAGIRKTSGNFLCGIGMESFSPYFNSRDLGYFRVTNYNSYNVNANYNIYNPTKRLRNSYNFININYNTLFNSSRRIGVNVSGESFTTLMNFTSLILGGGWVPLRGLDFNEPRVEGAFFQTAKFYHYKAGLSSDYRKKLALDLMVSSGNYYLNNEDGYPADQPFIDFNTYLRYRFTDKLTVRYGFNFNNDPFNPGFATMDSLKIIFGGRRIVTSTNNLSVKYIFQNNMSLNITGRHYWSKGRYRIYYELQDDGSLEATSTDYGKDFNYNAFTVDAVYSWIFSPGSSLNIVYKKAIEADEQVIIRRYYDDLSHTLGLPQNNSISVKFLYYLDYMYFKKMRANG